jgi:arsenical pump membrane protein
VSPLVRIPLTLGIFAATLGLILRRPRGWNEAWWALAGAVAMCGLGLVTLPEAAETAGKGKDAVLMLVALLCLSAVVGQSGFFEWAAIACVRLAGDDSRALFRNTFLLGALVTAALSLDTTAVMLTPIVIGFARRLDLPRRPYIIACAVVANCASLALPVSNLTNLLFVSAFHLPFTAFVLRMIGPQLVVLALTYAILRGWFRGEIVRRVDLARLPAARSVVAHPGFFRSSCAVLGSVCVGYFVAPALGVPVYLVAFAATLVLWICGAVQAGLGLAWLREIPWGAAVLALGLFIVVRGLENLGLVAPLAGRVEWLAGRSLCWTAPLVAATTAAASNGINNLPAALLARSVLEQAHAPTGLILASLIGADVGPNVTIVGSLATVLVLAVARGKGERIATGDLFRVGMMLTPAVLLAGALALAGELMLWPGGADGAPPGVGALDLGRLERPPQQRGEHPGPGRLGQRQQRLGGFVPGVQRQVEGPPVDRQQRPFAERLEGS